MDCARFQENLKFTSQEVILNDRLLINCVVKPSVLAVYVHLWIVTHEICYIAGLSMCTWAATMLVPTLWSFIEGLSNIISCLDVLFSDCCVHVAYFYTRSTRFIEITVVRLSVCLCVSVCRPPRLIITVQVKWSLNNWLNKLNCFLVSKYTAPAVNLLAINAVVHHLQKTELFSF